MVKKYTEASSNHDDLEQMTTQQMVEGINQEDQKVAAAVQGVMPDLVPLIDAIYEKMEQGGRLFYIGSGTSGRLGILDASECPPTFGVEHGKVIGIIAGGDEAIRKAKEFAEDDPKQAWQDLKLHDINSQDVVIGLSTSGTTPYVIGGLKDCLEHNVVTGCITCNHETPLSEVANYPIEVIVGPEFVTGSTRMKGGTAQKLILNTISTAVMIKLGHVQGNQMVDMRLSNEKLIDRGARMIKDLFDLSYQESKQLLMDHGSVRNVINDYDFTNKSFRNKP